MHQNAPTNDRRGGKRAEIGYAIAPCPTARLGWILLAATARGICIVRIGGSARGLEEDFKSEFPQATRNPSHPELARWLGQIMDHIAGSARQPQIPVDIEATSFQRRVWQELMRIPYGATRTYQEVARRIGNPKAVRAVGSACAANPVALVVPCHRVVRADGKLGGYRWGLERKKNLLKLERERASVK